MMFYRLLTAAVLAVAPAVAQPPTTDPICETSGASPSYNSASVALEALKVKGDIMCVNENKSGIGCQTIQTFNEANIVMCGQAGEMISCRDVVYYISQILDQCPDKGLVGGHVMYGGSQPTHDQVQIMHI